ncbi:PAS domain-containing protein [Sphingorhabdus sp.]|uniref:hybrid sensor histidine kinase/response regulator n=1 Tax=Sphingorhabdus sp. TaxID=1902408 RepID=UPI003918994F
MVDDDVDAGGEGERLKPDDVDYLQERLRLSEGHLQAVLESVDECFYALNTDWRFTLFNRASEEYFGISRDKILGRKLWDVFPQGLGSEYERCCRAAMEHGVGASIETSSLLRPGRFGDLRITPLTGGGIAISITDITKRKLAQDRALNTERELQILTDALPVLISYVDKDERYRFVNREYERWFGVKREDLLGRHVREVIGDDAYNIAKPQIQRAMSGERFRNEQFMPYKDAGAREVSIDFVPRIGGDGTPEGYYVLVQDIAERKHTERELNSLTVSLKQRVEETVSERDRIWNNSRDLLLVIEPEGTLRSVNPAWLATLGWTSEELVGRNYLEFIHPDDQLASVQALKIASQGELPPFEVRLRTKDGGYRSIAWVAVPEGGLVYGSGRDVTAFNAYQAELEQARAQLSEIQKMDTLGQLSGGIAHDFNNLLTPIVGALDMLRRKYKDDERSARWLSGALQASERARILVSRLLIFARRHHLEARPVDVAILVRDMLDLVRRTLGPQFQIHVEMAENMPAALVDPHQLELALLNLCVNGRDAMPDGGMIMITGDHVCQPASDPTMLPGGNFIRLSVEDCGHGMEPDVARRAVEPFFTTKEVGKGTGLGLSMVHGLAMQSGGYFHLESEAGEGTKVTITFPVAEALAGQALVQSDFEPITRAPTLSVLLVDDEDLVLEANAEMLRALGHRVKSVLSGSAALAELLTDTHYDLLLTDYMMPNMSGLQLIDEARRLRKDLSVALVTGFMGNRNLGDGIPRLAKPFRMTDLAQFLAHFAPRSGSTGGGLSKEH